MVIAANVGNLVAARTAARRGELAVRSALGAARRHLVLQLFGEVLLIGAAAAGLAAWGLVRLMASMAVWLGRDIPFWIDMMPGPPTWTFMAVVTVLACVVAGVIPALRATRGAPGDGLRSAGRGGDSAVFGRAASVMSVLQVAFSVALLGAALLAVRGMQRYADAGPALPVERILVAGTSLDPPGRRGLPRGRPGGGGGGGPRRSRVWSTSVSPRRCPVWRRRRRWWRSSPKPARRRRDPAPRPWRRYAPATSRRWARRPPWGASCVRRTSRRGPCPWRS